MISRTQNQALRGRRKRKPDRRGATALEMALILLFFLPLLLLMFDLGIAVFRYNVLAEAARQAARRAIVHGSMAHQPWGPEAFSGTATDPHELVADDDFQQFLNVLGPSDVNIEARWPNGNREGKRVKLTITAPYRPILALPSFGLKAESTMLIAH